MNYCSVKIPKCNFRGYVKARMMNSKPLCGMNTFGYHEVFRHLFHLLPQSIVALLSQSTLFIYSFIVGFQELGSKTKYGMSDS